MREWFTVKHNGKWVRGIGEKDIPVYTNDEAEARLYYCPIWDDFWENYPDAELIFVEGREG